LSALERKLYRVSHTDHSLSAAQLGKAVARLRMRDFIVRRQTNNLVDGIHFAFDLMYRVLTGYLILAF